jgi:hypothetical protein
MTVPELMRPTATERARHNCTITSPIRRQMTAKLPRKDAQRTPHFLLHHHTEHGYPAPG